MTGFGKVDGAIADAATLRMARVMGAYPSKQKKTVRPVIVVGVAATVLLAIILHTVSRKRDIDWEWEWTDPEGDYYE
jgi:hypothetical protein